MTNQESGAGTWVYINQRPSGLQSTLSTRDDTMFSLLELKQGDWLPGAEWGIPRPAWSRADSHGGITS